MPRPEQDIEESEFIEFIDSWLSKLWQMLNFFVSHSGWWLC